MSIKYFIDSNSVIHTDYGSDTTACYSCTREGDKIHQLDCEGFIVDTYTLYKTLHESAKAIEPSL